MKNRTWRDKARWVIYSTLRDLPEGTDKKIIRTLLRKAYPFGAREHWPYKVWCDEVRRTLKIGKPYIAKNQLSLFQ